MARRKRASAAVDRASTRSAALESIDKKLDLGNGMTLAAYNKALTETDAMLSAYNTRLSEVDGLLNQLEEAEKNLDDMSVRMLAGVAVKFGKDSEEYEKAGGTRPGDRKNSARKAAEVEAKV